MLRVGSRSYNPSSNSVRNNKVAQSKFTFGAITPKKAFEIGVKHKLPGYRAQQLIDRASNIERNIGNALENLKEQAKTEKGAFQKAIKELLTHQD